MLAVGATESIWVEYGGFRLDVFARKVNFGFWEIFAFFEDVATHLRNLVTAPWCVSSTRCTCEGAESVAGIRRVTAVCIDRELRFAAMRCGPRSAPRATCEFRTRLLVEDMEAERKD